MKALNKEWSKRFLANMSWGFGILHIVLAVLYLEVTAIPLLIANVACFITSNICKRLARKGSFRAYTLTFYISEMILLIITAVCAGRSSGYQIPLIGLGALVFFLEFLFRTINVPYFKALPLGIVDFVIYVTVFLFFYSKPGLLSISDVKAYRIGMLWSALIFAAIIVGMFAIIRMSNDSEMELNDKVETDPLTGLYNRAGYDRICSDANIKTTALLIIDTDKFKGINDRFGHETGDQVLKNIAWELKKNFRSVDRVCRIGGDEFAILMMGVEAVSDELVKNKICEINRELSRSSDLRLPHVSISVGVAHGSEAEDWVELFKKADSVLYQVKKEGGRGCLVYHQNT